MKIIDLHTHSTVSDGSCTPTEIIRLAEAAGLSVVALTDHDNIAGCAEAAAAAGKSNIVFLPGMEMTVDYDGWRLHIVALGFDPQHPAFRALYKKIRENKESRIQEIITGIQAKGISISWEMVRQYSVGTMDWYAIMRYLVSLHISAHAQPLWDRYINPVVRDLGLSQEITAAEGLHAIRAAGGVTSLAHFHKKIGLADFSRREQENAIADLHQLGMDGMERWYPTYSTDDAAFAAFMIEKYHLLATGGTDFHGANRPGIALGTGKDGNTAIPYRCYETVQQYLFRRKKEL